MLTKIKHCEDFIKKQCSLRFISLHTYNTYLPNYKYLIYSNRTHTTPILHGCTSRQCILKIVPSL